MSTRRIHADYLRSKGWNVFTASDGRAGLNKTIELTPDLIVLDLAMPKGRWLDRTEADPRVERHRAHSGSRRVSAPTRATTRSRPAAMRTS